VNQRTKEIGIRMALGGDPSRIRNLVLMEGMRLVLGSLAIGLIVSAALGRLVASLLFGVSPTDVVTLGAAAALLTVVAMVGCYLPARRATLVDPLVALRTE
jgi:ABC-type antimicrobial peptide transport system permease subunit